MCPKLFTVVGLVAPATPTPTALIVPVLRLVTAPPSPRMMASLKPLVLAIVPALSTMEGPPLVEPPFVLSERPVKPPVIVPPIRLMTVEPPPIKAPLEPAVIMPEFVRAKDASPVTPLPPAAMAPLLVSAQPGLATEATPVPGEAIVAAFKTVPLVTPRLVAQPPAPRTMGPFAPVMNPLASHAACAESPKARNAITKIAARPEVRITSYLGFIRPVMFAPTNVPSAADAFLSAVNSSMSTSSLKSVLVLHLFPEPVATATTMVLNHLPFG